MFNQSGAAVFGENVQSSVLCHECNTTLCAVFVLFPCFVICFTLNHFLFNFIVDCSAILFSIIFSVEIKERHLTKL